jgi:putative endonuclease
MQSKNNRLIGNSAEILACNHLQQQGLTLLKQNFYSRFGEIDLIMQDLGTIVFVEVKKRQISIDNAIESITPSKQKKLILTAQYYLLKTDKNVNCRFDVIAMDGNNNVKWLKNVIIL